MEDAADGLDLLGPSLLQWVQSFAAEDGEEKVEDGQQRGGATGWDGLSDGRRLWAILHDVDAVYFAGELPEPGVGATGDWTRKWQNLKFLERHIATYYRDVCNGRDGVGAEYVPDLKAVAARSAPEELEKLIMIIIRAAMASPESNQRMAQRLMSLGREKAMVVANELRNMEEPVDEESERVSQDGSIYQSEREPAEESHANGNHGSEGPYGDPLLQREEELLHAQATIEKLHASQAAAHRQLHELRQDKERLQEAFDAYRADIDTKGRRPAGDDTLLKLQRQTENDHAYIEDLEGQLQSSRSTVESYQRQIDRHKADGETSQKLRDDMQMLKAENEDLGQKVKANENLKKKIQSLQEQEKLNVSLRAEIKEANERLEELHRLKQKQAGLEKEIIEKRGLIRNQEYQINELTTTRKHAEYDARVLSQKLDAARERHDRDHEALEELRLKLQDSRGEDAELDDTAPEPSTPHPRGEEEHEGPPPPLKDDPARHLAEKLAMVEQQLEVADAQLKQTVQRNAALEEEKRNHEADITAQREAERRLVDQEKTIADLRLQAETLAQQPPPPPPKDVPTASRTDLAALQRENVLLTSAWYDLSSRLQNNGISLGVSRRRHEPRSWIGKQRALVGPSGSVTQHR